MFKSLLILSIMSSVDDPNFLIATFCTVLISLYALILTWYCITKVYEYIRIKREKEVIQTESINANYRCPRHGIDLNEPLPPYSEEHEHLAQIL
jgi:hypothetical protein